MVIRAGELRHRITIETQAEGTDGNPVGSWSTQTTAHASYEAVDGSEGFGNQQTRADVTGVFKMRYQPGISAANRVTWDGRTFDIVAALDPDGKKAELMLQVREAV